MIRYKRIFSQLEKQKLGAFVPFITLGDPNPIFFMKIINVLIQSGADALELGIPFSDPIADGPIIQKSIQRSFKSGTNLTSCWALLNNIRNQYPDIPIGLLIYINLVFRQGIENFYKRCAILNIDSILIPDLPIEEDTSFYDASIYYKIAQIFICPPNATTKLIEKITLKSKGYVYLLSRPGVTGFNKPTITNTTILKNIIQQIKQKKYKLPILQGFGIHTPTQAYTSLLSGTAGVISGSIIANIIDKNMFNIDLMLKKLEIFVNKMKTSMHLK